MTLGERIREARLVKGFKQDYLAAQINVEQSQISRWERDEVVPGGENLIALANVLGISFPIRARIEEFIPQTQTPPGEEVADISNGLPAWVIEEFRGFSGTPEDMQAVVREVLQRLRSGPPEFRQTLESLLALARRLPKGAD